MGCSPLHYDHFMCFGLWRYINLVIKVGIMLLYNYVNIFRADKCDSFVEHCPSAGQIDILHVHGPLFDYYFKDNFIKGDHALFGP